jgi:hypothetical protein
MKTYHRKALLLACVLVVISLSADAAERMRAGQWVGTTTVKDKTFNSATCMTQVDVDAMNGDVAAIRSYLEKTVPPSICKLSNIKANGGEIVYTTACGSAAPDVVTTKYHGDSFESTTTSGTTSSARWTGNCK